MAQLFGAELPSEDQAVAPSYTPPKSGKCLLQVVESDVEESKRTAGQMQAWFELEVMDHEDPDSIGKKFRHYCVTSSNDSKKLGGGLHNLLMICKACGLNGYQEMGDTEQLHFQPFEAVIDTRPGKPYNGKETWNTNISRWPTDLDGSAPATKQQPQQRPAQTGSAGGGAGDWRNRARG